MADLLLLVGWLIFPFLIGLLVFPFMVGLFYSTTFSRYFVYMSIVYYVYYGLVQIFIFCFEFLCFLWIWGCVLNLCCFCESWLCVLCLCWFLGLEFLFYVFSVFYEFWVFVLCLGCLYEFILCSWSTCPKAIYEKIFCKGKNDGFNYNFEKRSSPRIYYVPIWLSIIHHYLCQFVKLNLK